MCFESDALDTTLSLKFQPLMKPQLFSSGSCLSLGGVCKTTPMCRQCLLLLSVCYVYENVGVIKEGPRGPSWGQKNNVFYDSLSPETDKKIGDQIRYYYHILFIQYIIMNIFR